MICHELDYNKCLSKSAIFILQWSYQDVALDQRSRSICAKGAEFMLSGVHIFSSSFFVYKLKTIFELFFCLRSIEKLILYTGRTVSLQEESIIEKGKRFQPRTLSEIMVGNQVEKTRKLIQKAERAQLKILQRKKEWDEL